MADTAAIDKLLANIALDIHNLQNILDNVGTTSDTVYKRQEFTKLRDAVNDKISRATQTLSRSLSEDCDTTKYQTELQQYTASLRNIVAKAIKSFTSYRAHSAIITQHDEKSPLLASRSTQQTYNQQEFQSIAKNIKIVDVSKLIEEEEEKITEIQESLYDMKQMFETLDQIVNEQGNIVYGLEHNITITKEAIGAGKDELEIGDRNQRKSRTNKLILLVILIIVLAIIIAFVWSYDRSK